MQKKEISSLKTVYSAAFFPNIPISFFCLDKKTIDKNIPLCG